jgi:hypothetical protein
VAVWPAVLEQVAAAARGTVPPIQDVVSPQAPTSYMLGGKHGRLPMAHLNIGNPTKGRYSISFDSSDGTITCEVSALSSPLKGSSAEDERQAAMKRAKRLARAFCEALPRSLRIDWRDARPTWSATPSASGRLPPARQIAAEVGISPATVSRVLKRHGLNKHKRIEPAKPMHRDERDHPSEMCTTT